MRMNRSTRTATTDHHGSRRSIRLLTGSTVGNGRAGANLNTLVPIIVNVINTTEINELDFDSVQR